MRQGKIKAGLNPLNLVQCPSKSQCPIPFVRKMGFLEVLRKIDSKSYA